MQRPMRTSRQGLDLIKSFEGFRARSAALGNGRWIVGYGHTRTARDGLEISEADAAKILRHYDLPPIEAAIHRLVLATIHQNQFDALASFAFNLGLDAFRTSDVLAHVNAGEPLKAACAMGAWRRARVNGRTITIDALVRRRAMERALFLESPRGRPLAPSPIIRPERDPRIAETVLHETPAQIDTSGPAPRIVSGDTGAPNPAPAERTSEDIAKRIGERVTRILNESPGVPPDRAPDRPSPSAPAATEPAASAPALRQPAPPTPATPPPSADDIAAAVAALADPQPDPDQTNSGPDPSDLPPPPKLTTPPSRSGLVIDDLEPIEIADIPGLDPARAPIDGMRLTALGIAGLLGALIAYWGFGQVSRVASGAADFTDPWQMLIGPFAVVLGVVLAALMAVSALRTVLRR